MSFSFHDGVKLSPKRKRRALRGLFIALAEVVLSIFFYLAIGAHILYPNPSLGATGSPSLLSYEGYLTDASGNPLGGTGTPYCFRFSIYDNPVVGAGTKLWPAGTPATTVATSTDGVFSALVGQADALTYNFYDNDTTYLNVEVYTVAASGGTCTGGAFQTLSPRQQITASGYAISSENIYGALLQSQVANSRVQVGSGAGGASPIYLGLDVKNTADYVGQSCTTSGTVWYNSNVSKALVCENGVIQAISNAGGTTTVTALTANTGTPATTGTVVFSNANGVTFGINGNTITASVGAGGGVTVSQWEPYQFGSNTSVTSVAPASRYFQTVNLPAAVAVSNVRMLKSFNFAIPTATSTGSTGSEAYSFSQGFSLFTRQDFAANSSRVSYLTSGSGGISFSLGYSSTSQTLAARWVTDSTGGTSSWSTSSNAGNYSSYWTGLKYLVVPLVATLSAGEYWVGYGNSSTSATSNSNMVIVSISQAGMNFAANTLGNLGAAGSIASYGIGNIGVGSASAVTINNTMALSAISQVSSTAQINQYFKLMDL